MQTAQRLLNSKASVEEQTHESVQSPVEKTFWLPPLTEGPWRLLAPVDVCEFEFKFLQRKNFGGPSRTRTCDLLVRSQTLYPTELWAPEEGQNFKSYHCSIRS